MSISKSLSKIGLRQKLVLVVLMACLLPLAVISVLSSNTARTALETQAFNQLESLREVKKKQIEDFFELMRNQIITMSEEDTAKEAMIEFRAGYAALPDESGFTEGTLASNRAALANYYRNAFGEEYRAQNKKGINADGLVPTGASAIVAQYLYIANNSNPPGSKDTLDFAGDGSAYSDTHAKYHPQFRDFLEKFGYEDIFLIDPESGDIVYSVFKEIDFATSLLTGPHNKTNLARVFNEARKLGAGDSAVLVDFEPYIPSYDAAVSFIASPIYEGSTLTGVLIFEMPVGKINEIMAQRAGLGESGETYLIGHDLKMRSQSFFSESNSILTVAVETETAKAVMNGETGARIVHDYRGTPVLSSFTPLAIPGLDWGIMAEIAEAEAFAAEHDLLILTMILFAGGAVFAFLLAMFVARNVLQQLGADPARLLAVTEAITHNNLDMDLDTGKTASGVYAGMQTMQKNLRERIETDRRALAENTRVKSALDNVQGNVMMADGAGVIIYCNDAVLQMFRDAESDIHQVLPNFRTDNLVGSNVDVFHKNPAHQRGMLESLAAPHKTQIEVSTRTFAFVATPVFGDDKTRLGTVVEWTDRSQELAAERDVQAVVTSVLQGDLTRRICMNDKSGFFASISTGVNGIVDKLSGAMREIRVSSAAVHSGATEIATGNANLSQRTEEQAASLEETSSSMTEMTGTIRKNADDAAEANKMAANASDLAEKGGEVVGEAVAAMEEISHSSKQIADIIGAIDEIAFQTNLLALNASVEAARAGEQGRGFAVVASEVRNLAGRSATAAKEIKDLIENSVGAVEKGSQLVNESGEMLGEIVCGVRKVTDIVAKISVASEQQSVGVDEINTAVHQMDDMTQQNAALVEEIAAASENMRTQADTLNEVVSNYNVDAEERREMRFDTSRGSPTGHERRGADRPWADSRAGNGTKAPANPPKAAAAGDWAEF